MNNILEKLNNYTIDQKNWIDDFKFENGNYYNNCVFCKELFIGHKRRVACRQCVLNHWINNNICSRFI